MTEAIQLTSPLVDAVFYDANSLGIAIIDPVAMHNIQNDLRKVISNPALVIEINSTKHIYFRGTTNIFQIAEVCYNDNRWYVSNFDFDAALATAQAKFKEGKIIHQRSN
jgi:hypothetical protein